MKDRCDFSSQSVKKSHLDTYSYPFQAVKIGLLPNFVQQDLIPMYFFLKSDIVQRRATSSKSNRFEMTHTFFYV